MMAIPYYSGIKQTVPQRLKLDDKSILFTYTFSSVKMQSAATNDVNLKIAKWLDMRRDFLFRMAEAHDQEVYRGAQMSTD